MKKILPLVIILLFNVAATCSHEQDSTINTPEIIPCKEIEIGCFTRGRETGGEKIIRDSIQLYNLVKNNPSYHPDCDDYELPPIDFKQHTLIWYLSSIAGCEFPTVSHNITKQGEEYNINITVLQNGLCERNNPITVLCLVPRIDDSASVQFNVYNE